MGVIGMAAKSLRRQRELEQRRIEVLEVALDLFSRRGFEQTSMAEIAKRAGFAVGTLYTLFKDKDALYRRLILAVVTDFEQALNAALTIPGNEVAKIERYIETNAALLVKHRSLATMYFSQASRLAVAPLTGLDRDIQLFANRMLRRLEATLRAGMRKKFFIKMNPRLLALGLGGLSNAFLIELIERPDEFSADTMTQAAKKIFFEQVRLK
jgi:TetR/AcrR family transcriptional regulator